MGLIKIFKNLFKKEESAIDRIRRWDREKEEIQRLKEHEKARKPSKRKKSKPVTYSL